MLQYALSITLFTIEATQASPLPMSKGGCSEERRPANELTKLTSGRPLPLASSE